MLILDLKMFITARKRSLGQGSIFTPVCHFCSQGGVADTPTWADTPRADTPSPGQTPPPWADTPQDGGRYASYWNAFLLH